MVQTTSLWCGIDVAKNNFEAAFVIDETESNLSSIPVSRFANDADGIRDFLDALKRYAHEQGTSLKTCRIVMEATGRYSLTLYSAIVEQTPCLAPAIINPLKTSNFLKSLGLRNKTDAMDARALGIYGRDRQPAPYQPLDRNYQDLREMFRLRKALVDQRTANQLRLKEMPSGKATQLLGKVIKGIEGGIKKCETEMKVILNRNHRMGRDVKLLMTIPGVGFLTAVAVLAELGDLRRFKRSRQVTAYAGLAPRIVESGTSVRGRSCLSRVGNTAIRRALYMAALASRRTERSCLAKSYARLVGVGKSGKSALCALMRKLLVLMRAILVSEQPYQFPEEAPHPVENRRKFHGKLRLEPRF